MEEVSRKKLLTAASESGTIWIPVAPRISLRSFAPGKSDRLSSAPAGFMQRHLLVLRFFVLVLAVGFMTSAAFAVTATPPTKHHRKKKVAAANASTTLIVKPPVVV